MGGHPSAIRFLPLLLAVLLLPALFAAPLPVSALLLPPGTKISPGTYAGTLIFTIDHTYNRGEGSVIKNYYSFRAEDVMGEIRFRSAADGTVAGMNLHIPPFPYDVVSSQEIIVPPDSQGPYHCTGNNFYGAGQGTISGGSGSNTGAPPLADFFSRPVKIDVGDPWARGSLSGNCPVKADTQSFIDGFVHDIQGTPSSPFVFRVTWQGFQSVGGTCSSSAWTMTDRSITCYWAAYSNGYRRLTAPGP